MDKLLSSRAIAITGMGIISSVAKNCLEFRDALLQGRSNFKKLSYPMLSFPIIGAVIENFNFKISLESFQLTKEQFSKILSFGQSLPQPVQIALIAAIESWQQAQFFKVKDTARTALIIAAQNATTNYQYSLFNKFIDAPDYFSPNYALQFMDSSQLGVISEALGIFGEGFTIGGASATGNVGLWKGYQLIRDKFQDACLVVGSMADLSPMEFQALHNLSALGGENFENQPNQACRPFDINHNGFIYGQAAGAILLESIESAKSRGVPILGYLIGGALNLDGNHLTNPSLDGEIRTMRQALESARDLIDIRHINYINTHGTGTPIGDEVEIKAIESIFSDHLAQIKINATKSITGHTLWSAGVIEAIATILQMQFNFVHPTLNLEIPISDKSNFVRLNSEEFQIINAISNSYGFYGINSTLVFAKAL